MSDEVNGRTHVYNAEAMAISGSLTLPVEQPIEPQAHSQLDPEGGYFSQRASTFRLQSLISYNAAYTHVAGNKSTKTGEGWNTLTTTVVEGLNVMDVVTADRVVGQMITQHPLVGYTPSVSFLGTRYENLRIAGYPVEVDFDHEIFGLQPVEDLPYAKEAGFLSRVLRQYDRILRNKNLPDGLKGHYNQLATTLGAEAVECSLVNQVAGRFPGSIFGHVITIPGFGAITLGKVTVKHEDPHEMTRVPKKTTVKLTMIDLKFGCVIAGTSLVGTGSSNGESQP